MMSITYTKRLLRPQADNRQGHNNAMVIVCVNLNAALYALGTSMNNNLSLTLLNIRTSLAQFI
ncbi:hypothetical protein D3C78_908770 [compost metagenome]